MEIEQKTTERSTSKLFRQLLTVWIGSMVLGISLEYILRGYCIEF